MQEQPGLGYSGAGNSKRKLFLGKNQGFQVKFKKFNPIVNRRTPYPKFRKKINFIGPELFPQVLANGFVYFLRCSIS